MTPYFVEGRRARRRMHQQMAATWIDGLREIEAIQQDARASGAMRPAPMADDRPAHPQGLDRAKEVDGLPVEGTWQVASGATRGRSERIPSTSQLETWMRSYRTGRALRYQWLARCSNSAAARAHRHRRMSANPHANGGLICSATSPCRTFASTPLEVAKPAETFR